MTFIAMQVIGEKAQIFITCIYFQTWVVTTFHVPVWSAKGECLRGVNA